ncbi:amino acid ABC transporter permease [Mobilicoccus caccae]|uniref:Glutamate ABC transporter permease n=1 Tax=Mobilicoccus caccae TaxID=1859295 RepID=A0ABQ6ISM5_9MICO|nr:amino acid ABC transporter permease [Mobilicoccus caccae]GMA40157.1 glutamate ABC transporter permease [Mobilicoccus caccae]
MGEVLTNYDVLGAFWMTIKLAVLSTIGALAIGTVLAIFRLSPVGLLRGLGAFYVNIVRNTPLTLIVLFTMLGAHSNLRILVADPSSPTSIADTIFRWGVIALALYHAAFVCEALRSGVNTIPVGQAEAARSLGLSFGQNLRHVILPQAFRGAIVPLGNVVIALTKNTTVVAVIGVAEIAYLTATVMENDPGLIVWLFVVVALGFVILTVPLGLATTHYGRKLAVQR